MADDEKCMGLGLQHFFQPEYSLDVQVVGRFVHQQHVWLQHQRLRDRETFLPPSGERRDGLVDAYEASEAEGPGHSAAVLMGVQTAIEENLGERFLDRVRRGKRRFLGDIANTDLAPNRPSAAIRLVEACQYFAAI